MNTDAKIKQHGTLKKKFFHHNDKRYSTIILHDTHLRIRFAYPFLGDTVIHD